MDGSNIHSSRGGQHHGSAAKRLVESRSASAVEETS